MRIDAVDRAAVVGPARGIVPVSGRRAPAEELYRRFGGRVRAESLSTHQNLVQGRRCHEPLNPGQKILWDSEAIDDGQKTVIFTAAATIAPPAHPNGCGWPHYARCARSTAE